MSRVDLRLVVKGYGLTVGLFGADGLGDLVGRRISADARLSASKSQSHATFSQERSTVSRLVGYARFQPTIRGSLSHVSLHDVFQTYGSYFHSYTFLDGCVAMGFATSHRHHRCIFTSGSQSLSHPEFTVFRVQGSRFRV